LPKKVVIRISVKSDQMNTSRIIFPGQWINREYPPVTHEEDKKLFERQLQAWSREVRIQEMKKVCLNNELFIKQGFRFRIQMESFGDYWQDKVYNKPAYQLKSFVKNLLRKNKPIDRALWCFDQFSTGGYFHWVTEIAPRLWVADQYIDPAIPLLIPEYFITKWNFATAFLTPFNRRIITFKDNELPIVDNLTFISQTGGPFNYQPVPIRSSTALLKQYYFDSSYPADQWDKIYISRKHSGKRMILNEPEVEKLVTSFGYKVIQTEQQTIRDQVNVFSRAKRLVSIHGAGLSNMVFMPEGSSMIEIRHKVDNPMLNFFYNLAHTFNHHYYYSFGNDLGDSLKTELRAEDKSVHADLDMLKDALKRIDD